MKMQLKSVLFLICKCGHSERYLGDLGRECPKCKGTIDAKSGKTEKREVANRNHRE